MSKTTIRLTGPALEQARAVHRLHLEAHAKKEELEREFQESMRRLGAEVQEQMTARWKELLTAAGLPEEDLGKWQLDASYLTDHGCAFMSREEDDAEAPSLSDLLQAAASVRH